MEVQLRSLQPNPMRDFRVDPMDPDAVERLRQSIEEDGFWGGVVCRQIDDGTIQIGAGHHRVAAAIAAGIEFADVYVGNGNMTDAVMIRVYARENATQRGNSGAAQVGTVAAAVRFVAKAIMGGVSQEFLRNEQDLEKVRGNLTSDRGIGHSIIERFLSGIPGINAGTVQQALANLKTSGDYARIIGEVQEEIERENKEALIALAKAEKEKAEAEEQERAAKEAFRAALAAKKGAKEEADKKRAELERKRAVEESKVAEKRQARADAEMKQFAELKTTRDTATKATEAANKKPVTFDFEGVAKHLKNANQIDAFRACVTGEGIASLLPVDKQAELAKHLVDEIAEKNKLEQGRRGPKTQLTAEYIRNGIVRLVVDAKRFKAEADKSARDAAIQNDLARRFSDLQQNFSSYIRSAVKEAVRMKEFMQKHGKSFPIKTDFRSSLATAVKVFGELNERI